MYYDKFIILQIIYIVNIFYGNIFHIPASLCLSANNLLSAGAVQCLDGHTALPRQAIALRPAFCCLARERSMGAAARRQRHAASSSIRSKRA